MVTLEAKIYVRKEAHQGTKADEEHHVLGEVVFDLILFTVLRRCCPRALTVIPSRRTVQIGRIFLIVFFDVHI
jgi:hypothetical protein